MARLLLSIVPKIGANTELIEEVIMENRSTVTVNYGYLAEHANQLEIKGSAEELLKLQQAFTTKGQTSTLVDT